MGSACWRHATSCVAPCYKCLLATCYKLSSSFHSFSHKPGAAVKPSSNHPPKEWKVTQKAAMLGVFHLVNFTGLRSTAIASSGVKTNFLGRMQKIIAGSRVVILPLSPQKQQTTTFHLNSKRNQKLTHLCGSEGLTKKRVFGSGQTAVHGSLKLGWKIKQLTFLRNKIALSSLETGGHGTMMIAPKGTISCVAKGSVQAQKQDYWQLV